jgi:hypothetical protein
VSNAGGGSLTAFSAAALLAIQVPAAAATATAITNAFLVRKLADLAMKPAGWDFMELLRNGFV